MFSLPACSLTVVTDSSPGSTTFGVLFFIFVSSCIVAIPVWFDSLVGSASTFGSDFLSALCKTSSSASGGSSVTLLEFLAVLKSGSNPARPEYATMVMLSSGFTIMFDSLVTEELSESTQV